MDAAARVSSKLVACAESTGVNAIVSFDKSIDRVDTVERAQPGRSRR